ncbi:MAG: hypothetical protein WCT07_02095 [Candidatus Paceibacterota bacterium]|jgi:hypothetical protein
MESTLKTTIEIDVNHNDKNTLVEALSFSILKLNITRAEFLDSLKGVTAIIHFADPINIRNVQAEIIDHIAELSMDPDVLLFKLN